VTEAERSAAPKHTTESVSSDVVVEPVGAALPPSAVSLAGQDAAPLVDLVSAAAVEGGKALARAGGDPVYRLVPRKDIARGLKDGTLRYGASLKGGDATVLVKAKDTGKVVGHADLKRAGTSATKLLGPAAWQALALATQQHYLVEINSKLAGLEQGVSEVLAQLSDDKRGELEELRDVAKRTRDDLDRGDPPTETALEQYLYRAGALANSLTLTSQRAAEAYATGDRDAAHAAVEFSKAVLAMQTLAELSALIVALPVDSVGQLQHRLDQERARVAPRHERLRSISATLERAHCRWAMHHAIYEHKQPSNSALRQFNKHSPKKLGGARPLGTPLPQPLVQQLAQLSAQDESLPSSLLVEVGQNGDVRVAVERTAGDEAVADELTDDVVDRAVTQYGKGEWWVHGRYGPYTSRQAAVTRLRTLGPTEPNSA
jgi:hypothetical protein